MCHEISLIMRRKAHDSLGNVSKRHVKGLQILNLRASYQKINKNKKNIDKINFISKIK
jgi:hypothetical protein